jgi:ABC-type ATPase involved in cell division
MDTNAGRSIGEIIRSLILIHEVLTPEEIAGRAGYGQPPFVRSTWRPFATQTHGEHLMIIEAHGVHKTYRSRRMGFIFQTFNLLPVLTAVENVELPLLVSGVRPAVARRSLKALLTAMRLTMTCPTTGLLDAVIPRLADLPR